MKQFLSGNTRDQMNAFDGKKIDFFAKISPTKGDVQPTQSPNP